MIKIRLARFGKKNDPFYRIVAIEQRRKREGQHVEILGFWQPRTNTKKIEKKAIAQWVQKGAVVTAAVTKLL